MSRRQAQIRADGQELRDAIVEIKRELDRLDSDLEDMINESEGDAERIEELEDLLRGNDIEVPA